MSDDANIQDISLPEMAKHRYLNYAMSVISSRALPDVRDGLKPVQRRILYAMYHNLGLKPDARFRKSAAVVGEVMAKYHPHGDSSIYDAMVRMAQPFSMRYPLVDGQGNFGSMDGDGAAAMRYTEAKLLPVASSLLEDIKKQTVDFRANYDGQHQEPVTLPVGFPQILVNGGEGIAVGMATKIPPHNLREVVAACIALIDDPHSSEDSLFESFKGPDFPTGGKLLNPDQEIQDYYRAGSGTFRVQGKWRFEKRGKTSQIVVYEIPYGVNKSLLVEKIGEIVAYRKLPMALDVRDESAEDIRIVIEVKSPEDAEPVMAYLFKRTPLESTFAMNLTCLFPTGDEKLPMEPRKANLREILTAWLGFRFGVIERRFEHQLQNLRERIHVLEGFKLIYSNLDRAIEIIRSNSGKRACAQALLEEFPLSQKQVGIILDTPLYKLSKLEVQGVLQELDSNLKDAGKIDQILASPEGIWAVVREDLLRVWDELGDERRTEVGGKVKALEEFSAEDLIVDERAYLFATREGWVKRMSSYSTPDKVRVLEGDELSWVVRSSTKHCVSFFTNKGVSYTARLLDIQATAGSGDPIQKMFSFGDGEKIVGVIAHDDRVLPSDPTLVAVTSLGRLIRSPLDNYRDPSTKNGRKFASLGEAGDHVVAVCGANSDYYLSLATRHGQVSSFPLGDTPSAKGAAKGVTGIRLMGSDRVIAFGCYPTPEEGVTVETTRGRIEVISYKDWKDRRATTGKTVITRGELKDWARPLTVVDK